MSSVTALKAATVSRVARRTTAGGPPPHCRTRTMHEPENAVSTPYTSGAEKLTIPVSRLTAAIVGGAARNMTRQPTTSRVHTARMSGWSQPRRRVGALISSARIITDPGT